MSQDLFEKYLRNELTDPERQELLRLLDDEARAREFVGFLQEWSVMADLSRQLAEAGRESAREAAGRLRHRASPAPARPVWGYRAIGIAAAAVFMVALALALRPERPRETPVVLEPPPVPEPERPLPEVLVPLRERPLPAPPPLPEPVRDEPRPAPPPTPPPPPPPEAPKVEPPAPPPPVPPPAPKPTLTVVAAIDQVRGDALLLGASESVAARPGLSVHAGEGLETKGGASAAVVRYVEGTTIELGPATKIEAFLERAGKRLLVTHGQVTAQVAPQPKGKPLVIATPHAEVTVLGTQFAVRVEPEGTRLDVLEGRVRFTRSSDQRSVEIPAGRSITTGKGIPWETKPLVLVREFQDGLFPVATYAGTRDAGISEVQPTASAGTGERIEVDGDDTGGKSLWALLSWDLSSIPPASVVREAVITLHVAGTSKSEGYAFYEMKRPWVEGEATWKGPFRGQTWGASGATSKTDRGPDVLGTFYPRERGTAAILLNDAGLALVQAWVRNPRSNHGLLIGRDTNSDGFSFDARESATPSRRPKLTVAYTPGK